MPMVPKILLGLYLLFLVVAGWRLFGIGWTRRVKILAGPALVLPVPLLFLIPALTARGDHMAGLLLPFGLTLLVCGALCLAGGMVAARLAKRRA